MKINSCYYLNPERARKTLDSLHRGLINKLPSREVSTSVVLEDFYRFNDDYVSIEQVYGFDQLQGESLRGKPKRIRQKRRTVNATTYNELGYTSNIDLGRIMQFLNYTLIGTLTQIKTGFIVRDALIELPVVVNETKEFGCFIEVGDTVGAIEDINFLLDQVNLYAQVSDKDIVFESYGELLERVRNR